MNRIKTGKVGIGVALAALALMAGCASMTDDESLGVADEALVTTVAPGIRLNCSMAAVGGRGRRRAFLVVTPDLRTCLRVAVPGNVPAVRGLPSCVELGRNIGCEEITSL